ncbi:DUF1853 family protein [Bizionia arctica]|uniref:DUF1853 family protein n=1 Tax=Bizionia arctica TaxID=1495645 RepID=A0A917GI08_9FLAO|nr:DUF1853 family protein [Bizionia arctica]GGG46528.1 hypothetical protein GCM10010976_17520 [Bizionia arctica]
MDFKALNSQYRGYLNTPNLWFGRDIYNLQQLELQTQLPTSFNETISPTIRLGKRVEQFVFHQLKQHPQVSILAENIQIQKDKLTLGEIDGLLLINKQPVHLEIVYKFYVYDESVGTTELDHWIGPNRKDSLVEKLDKLKNKQLPLLYRTDTLSYLQKYQLEIEQIEQKVLFKAQLFLPYLSSKTHFQSINKACISGCYLKKTDLQNFKDCKFHIPNKANWLMEPHAQVSWQLYPSFMEDISPVLEQQTSRLVWIKHPNGLVEKCFIVWW